MTRFSKISDGKNNYTGLLLGFTLTVSNSTNQNEGVVCYKDTNHTRSTIPFSFDISCPVIGQYVSYYNERLPDISYPAGYSQYAQSALCEVEVYGNYCLDFCLLQHHSQYLQPFRTNVCFYIQNQRYFAFLFLYPGCPIPGFDGPHCAVPCFSSCKNRKIFQDWSIYFKQFINVSQVKDMQLFSILNHAILYYIFSTLNVKVN